MIFPITILLLSDDFHNMLTLRENHLNWLNWTKTSLKKRSVYKVCSLVFNRLLAVRMSVRSDEHESFDKITVVEQVETSLLDSNTLRTPPTLIVTSPLYLENSDVGVFNDVKRKHRPNLDRYERESHQERCWSSTFNGQSGMSRIHLTMRYKQKQLCFPIIFLTIF